MSYEPCEPPVDWKRVKETFQNAIRYLETEHAGNELPIVDYWISELFRFRSYLQGRAAPSSRGP